MARFTLALGQSVSDHNRTVLITLRLVNLHRDENIAEDYLRSVNPKGQVPALTGPDLDPPLADSLDISYWACGLYPKLLPKQYEATIKEFLSNLHNIQALSLSVPPEDCGEKFPCPAVDAVLAKEDIRPQYRQALERKRDFHKKHLESALEAENIASAENQARELFMSVMALWNDMAEEGATWMLGDGASPTLLDAHLVPFIVRLLDCGRSDLVPEKLQIYARTVTSLPSWREVTHGRSTLWDVSIGHVHLLENI